MQVTITWTAVGTICGLLTMLGAFMYWAVKSIVNEAITGAMTAINGRYVYSKGSELTGHEIENRILSIERRIDPELVPRKA